MAKKPRRLEQLNSDKVAWYQRELGLNDEQLARKADVTPATLGKWMAGGGLYKSNLKALAKALGVSSPNSLTQGFEEKDERKPTLIEGNVRFSGMTRAFTPELMAKIAEDFSKLLNGYGIATSSYQCQLVMVELADQLARIIVLVYGILENNEPFWVFVAVKPSKYQLFLSIQKAGALDLYEFEPFGEIIVSGEGKMPPDDITLKVAAMYQTDPATLFQPVDAEEEVNRRMHEYKEKQKKITGK